MKKKAWIVVLIIALIVLVCAVLQLGSIERDYHIAQSTYEELADEYTEDDSGDDSWKYVKIDFESLQAINPDVVGWIRFDDTDAVNVDYPIMYSTEDGKYLRTDIYGEYSYSGSIFLEALNAPDFSDCYNILYGHNMKNGSMFGTLRRYRDDENFWEQNRYFTIYTPDAAMRYEIFAYENTLEDSVLFTVGYEHDAQYGGLITHMLSVSIKDTGIVPTSSDSIVTLSTCSSAGDEYRFVVHAVLIDSSY